MEHTSISPCPTRPSPRWTAIVVGYLGVATLGLVACTGTITGPGSSDPASSDPASSGPAGQASPVAPGVAGTNPAAAPGMGGPGADPLGQLDAFGLSGPRRLSREELRQTLQDLLGVDVRDKLDLLPNDGSATAFDNSFTDQDPSAALLEGVRAIADAATDRVMANPTLRNTLVGCNPSGPGDEACLRSFVERFGRRVFRRPIEPDEMTKYLTTRSLAVEAKDFYVAVDVLLRALLQDMQFLYRLEIGAPVSGAPQLLRLNGFEAATRLSYLLWGSAPNDELLNLAQQGRLQAGQDVGATAAQMLKDPRAVERVKRFHALWLGYERMAVDPALAGAMRRESDALVARAAFGTGASWLDLFQAGDTYIDSALAKHYGLPAPTGGSGWVQYARSGRQGVLGHGSVLSNGQKFGKTSVTQRGKYIYRTFLCQEIPPAPPELAVDVAEEPKGAGPCKADNLRAHSTNPACAGCHKMLDGAGFGLERYDLQGRSRTKDETGCAVADRGEIPDNGGVAIPFSGPAELSTALVRTGRIEQCVVERLYEFTMGRPQVAGDGPAVGALLASFRANKRGFTDLLLGLVSAKPFLYRSLN